MTRPAPKPAAAAARPLALLDRHLPADEWECLAVSALTWPLARETARRIGITPAAFADPRARRFAVLLMADVPDDQWTPDDLAALRDDGRTLPWGIIAASSPTDPAWACSMLERFAADRFRAWVPRLLRVLAAQIERHRIDLVGAAAKLASIVRLAARSRRGEQRAAA